MSVLSLDSRDCSREARAYCLKTKTTGIKTKSKTAGITIKTNNIIKQMIISCYNDTRNKMYNKSIT